VSAFELEEATATAVSSSTTAEDARASAEEHESKRGQVKQYAK
jgi:hypothetical protein